MNLFLILVDNPLNVKHQISGTASNLDIKPCGNDCYILNDKIKEEICEHVELNTSNSTSDGHSTSLSSTSSYYVENHTNYNLSKWTNADKSLVRVLIDTFSNDYCTITKCLPTNQLKCNDIYEFCHNLSLQNPTNSITSSESSTESISKSVESVFTKRSKAIYQNPYHPCDHSGPCSEENNCSCIKLVNFCEKYCQCKTNCRNRFIYCVCKSHCDKRFCKCFAAGRECDPDLCGNCGADEIDEKSIRCKNMSIQRGWKKHLLMIPSIVVGWGVALKDGAKKNDFITEYCGEMISNEEAERRGKIYDKIESSYLFNLNNEYVIDARFKGNKSRFINHSTTRVNCKPKVLMVNGDSRIGLYAIKDIKPFEELFFDYGYAGYQLKLVHIEIDDKKKIQKHKLKRKRNAIL